MKVSQRYLGRLAIVALLLLVWGASASAQRGKWWQDEAFQEELGLTAEQSERLEAIFQNTQPTLRQRMHALDEAEQVFDRIVETGSDETVMNQVDVVETARAELNKTRTMMLLRMRRVLTRDQWATFTALAQSDRTRTDDRRPPR